MLYIYITNVYLFSISFSFLRIFLACGTTFGCQTTVAALELSFFYFRKNENREKKSQTTENQQLRLTAVMSCLRIEIFSLAQNVLRKRSFLFFQLFLKLFIPIITLAKCLNARSNHVAHNVTRLTRSCG